MFPGLLFACHVHPSKGCGVGFAGRSDKKWPKAMPILEAACPQKFRNELFECRTGFQRFKRHRLDSLGSIESPAGHMVNAHKCIVLRIMLSNLQGCRTTTARTATAVRSRPYSNGRMIKRLYIYIYRRLL
jgi:hypothetical protein